MVVDFQPWGLAAGANPGTRTIPMDYTPAERLPPLQLLAQPKRDTSFYVAGNLSAYNTGGYSIQNTRTRVRFCYSLSGL